MFYMHFYFSNLFRQKRKLRAATAASYGGKYTLNDELFTILTMFMITFSAYPLSNL